MELLRSWPGFTPKQRGCDHSHRCFRGQNQTSGSLQLTVAPPSHSMNPSAPWCWHQFSFSLPESTALKTVAENFWFFDAVLVCSGDSIALTAASLIKCLGKGCWIASLTRSSPRHPDRIFRSRAFKKHMVYFYLIMTSMALSWNQNSVYLHMKKISIIITEKTENILLRGGKLWKKKSLQHCLPGLILGFLIIISVSVKSRCSLINVCVLIH